MKNWILTSAIVLLSVGYLAAQNTVIFGSVIDEEDTPLVSVTIQINQVEGTSTSSNGIYSIDYHGEYPIRLEYRYLGYTPFDTIINSYESEVEINVKLLPSENRLSEIQVTDVPIVNILGKECSITDFAVDQSGIYILSTKRKQSTITRYLLSGTLTKSTKSDNQYLRFHNSNSNLHLVGGHTCSQIISYQDHLGLTDYSADQFYRLVEKKVLDFNGQYIFKTFSLHNKKATYFHYPEPSKSELICEIHDKKAESATNSYYKEIIGTYYKTIASPEEDHISYGITHNNIIKDGTWNGDLMKLVVSNDLQRLISYYLTVESRRITTHEFVLENRLLIFDFVNGICNTYNEKYKLVGSVELDQSIKWQKCQIIQDNKTKNLYLINRKRELYRMDHQTDKINLMLIGKLDNKNGIISKSIIYGNVVYYLIKNTHNAFSRISTFKIG